jgi:signal transduction histidine kinase
MNSCSSAASSTHEMRLSALRLAVLTLMLVPIVPYPGHALPAESRPQQIARLLELLTSGGVAAQEVVNAGVSAAADPAVSKDPELYALALSVQCRGYYRLSDLPAAQRSCDAARVASRSDLARFAAERMQATLVAERGRPTDAIPLFLDSQAAAERSGNRFAIAAALGNLGAVAQFAGANAEAVDYYDRALALAAQLGADGLQATLGSNFGYLLVEAGKAELAREAFERALAAALRSRSHQAEFTIRNGLAHAQLAAGQADEAVLAFRRLLADPDVFADAYQLAEGKLFLARAELAAGHPIAAEAAARVAVDGLAQRSPLRTYPAYAVLIDALVANRKLNEAETVSSRLMTVVPETARGRFELLQARARLLSVAQRHREAYEVLLEADRVRESQSISRAEDRLAFMRARNEASEREAELLGLRQQQTLVAATAERDRLIRDFSLALAALVVLGAVVYWTTVRTRRQLELQIARRQHIDALGKLTGGVAHDFNNLMTIVQQAMDLLRRKPSLQQSGDIMTLVDEADAAARLGGRITQQLLAFARQKPMHPEIVPLTDFFERQRPLLERSLGASMTLSMPKDVASRAIRVDPSQLTTALINLLANARDAMDGSGTVQLGVADVDNSGRDRRYPELAAGRYVAISVADRGQGMTAEAAREAVTPFFTTKGDIGGSGLGLSTVDGFVNQSGGALSIQSDVGAGTTVTMLFPLIPPGPIPDSLRSPDDQARKAC